MNMRVASEIAAPRSRIASPWSPMRVSVLCVLGVLTLGGSAMTQRLVKTHQQARFDHEVRRVEYAVVQRLNAYVQVLRGGAGLFEASDDVSRVEWLRYVDTLQLDQRYPGFKALSFLAAVTPAQLETFVAGVRAEPLPPGMTNPQALRAFTPGLPEGTPSDAAPAGVHALVLYVAPLNPDNELALGRDQMREPGRRAALERSLATRSVALSPRLRMPQVGGSQVGFVAYMPVVRGDELRGWLTAAFFADRFMAGLLGASPQALNLEIYDGNTPSPQSLLYSTAGVDDDGGPRLLPTDIPAPLTVTRVIDLPGRQWTLRYVAGPDFVAFTDRLAPWLSASGGLLAMLLFYSVARAGAQWRAQAEELRVAEAAVRYQATHDPLTGLANRALFMDRLDRAHERALRQGRGFALAYIDIDHFKPVNDDYGHHVGDELLKAIAGRLRRTVREADTVARLGGDEFAILLEGEVEAPVAVERLCHDLVDSLCAPYAIGTLVVRVGASLGLALYPQHGANCEALIVAADRAMYQAKREGPERVVLAIDAPCR